MDRREVIRKFLFSHSKSETLLRKNEVSKWSSNSALKSNALYFRSNWHELLNNQPLGQGMISPNMNVWYIEKGELYCKNSEPESLLIINTHCLRDITKAVTAETVIRFMNTNSTLHDAKNFVGFRIGIQPHDDPRHLVASNMSGINMGITKQGFLLMDDKLSTQMIPQETLYSAVRLVLSIKPQSIEKMFIKLTAIDNVGNTLAIISGEHNPIDCIGSMGLVFHSVAHYDTTEQASVIFKYLEIAGEGMEKNTAA